MQLVYDHAVFTLAATASHDSESGLFCESRRPAATIPPVVTTKWDNLANNTFCLVDTRLWGSQVEDAPLNQRAWVVQERYLSPRVLSFAKCQMLYECCSSNACESFPGPAQPSQLLWSSLDRFFGDSSTLDLGRAARIWKGAVAAYARAQLTKDGDKVIAFAGIAQKMQDLTHDQYIVGLWRHQFELQLLWHCSQADESIRLSPRVAPTWSWLSFTGRVSLMEADKFLPLVQIQNISVDLVDPDAPTGNIRSASLRLRGSLKPAQWFERPRYCKADFRRYRARCDGVDWPQWVDKKGIVWQFLVDIIPDPEVLREDIFLLPVAETDAAQKYVLGLVIVGKNEPRIYERVGMFRLRSDAARGLFERKQTEKSARIPSRDSSSDLVDPLPQAVSFPTSGRTEWERIPPQDIVLV